MSVSDTTLVDGCARLGIALSSSDAQRLRRLLDELLRWNRAYNLTAIVDPQRMLTHHVLDSLAVNAALHGARIADVGTGAGFPGLPLAVINPARHFTLIDASNKKVRFVAHAARELGLANVDAVHARAEALTPAEPFDTIVARAFASLADLAAAVQGMCGPQTRVLALKGLRPDREIAQLPPVWRVESVQVLAVPGLDETRHLVVLRHAAAAVDSGS